MRTFILGLCVLATAGTCANGQQPAKGQDAREFVRRAVQNEMAKDAADHSHWLYFENDRKPEHPVKQWVADTGSGSLKRVLEVDGHQLSPEQQQQQMDAFIQDPSAQARQRKNGAHDDREAGKMLQMLPDAFIWTCEGERGGDTLLHFKPDPSFDPPDMEAKVFAAMEGDMAVDTKQMRIATLKGKLTQDVTFMGGLLGRMFAGGTFDVERRETGGGVWQITESHVHMNGHVLLFKTISEQEDDVKTDFKELPGQVSLQQARQDLMQAQPQPDKESARATR